MNFWPSIEQEIIKRLKSELPDTCFYHSPGHTKDVLAQSLVIAEEIGLSDKEIEVLKLAALFHDTGFVFSPKAHEENSCVIAEKRLQELDVEQGIINQVKSAIMATKIPQNPKNKIEEVLCDADLDYLGRDDFYEIGNKLFQELKVQNIVADEVQWNELQAKFLSSHSYFTEYSKLKRAPKKEEYLQEIKDWLKKH